MSYPLQLTIFAVLWVASIAFVTHRITRQNTASAGLPLAFLVATSFMHLGAISYIVPDYTHDRIDGSLYLQSYQYDVETVVRGSLASLVGILGFALGTATLPSRIRVDVEVPVGSILSNQKIRQLLSLLLALGMMGFFLTALDVRFPMAQAIFQVLRNLAIAAVCLGPALMFIRFRQRRVTVPWLLAAVAIPAIYVTVFGFTSFGFISFSIFVSFWLCFLMARKFNVLVIATASVVILTFLLSAFVSWMSFRDQIREQVWGGAGIEARLEVLGAAIADIEALEPTNFAALDQLNTRLNHNIFVGKVIEWHDRFPELRLYGKQWTLIPFALVPRALWPGKPEMGGSEFLSTHTGMAFSDSVTFGAGPIIEFFVNFGTPGVFFGMLLLGLIVRWVDLRAIKALRSLEIFAFARWFTVGIAFIAPLTELFFMFNTALMSFLLLILVEEFFRSFLKRSHRAPAYRRSGEGRHRG